MQKRVKMSPELARIGVSSRNDVSKVFSTKVGYELIYNTSLIFKSPKVQSASRFSIGLFKTRTKSLSFANLRSEPRLGNSRGTGNSLKRGVFIKKSNQGRFKEFEVIREISWGGRVERRAENIIGESNGINRR